MHDVMDMMTILTAIPINSGIKNAWVRAKSIATSAKCKRGPESKPKKNHKRATDAPRPFSIGLRYAVLRAKNDAADHQRRQVVEHKKLTLIAQLKTAQCPRAHISTRRHMVVQPHTTNSASVEAGICHAEQRCHRQQMQSHAHDRNMHLPQSNACAQIRTTQKGMINNNKRNILQST
jgi:hypothetical protein